MIHTIQPPQFALNALEPYFDAATMDLHVNKHHQGYADKLNAALASYPDLQSKTLEDLIAPTNRTAEPPNDQSNQRSNDQTILNMAGGVLNHNFFWSILSNNFDQPVPEVFQPFIEPFTASASSLFGSGWVWLVSTIPGSPSRSRDLSIIATPNQDSPIAQGYVPLLTLDLW